MLAWNDPDPSTTVVVKLTLTIDRGRRVTIARRQLPLSLERPWKGSGGDCYYPSDFAPRKVGVDVMCVGHARSPEARAAIPFALAAGNVELRGWAVGEGATKRRPLWSRLLYQEPQARSALAALAPRPITVDGWESRTVAPGFDFSAFNSAARDLRQELLKPRARLVLDGLLAATAYCATRLPVIQPALFTFPLMTREPSAARRVALRCDTLWIDSDSATCVMCWRGDFARDPTIDHHIALGMVFEHPSQPHGFEAVLPALERGQWRQVVEMGDLRAGMPVTGLDDPTFVEHETDTYELDPSLLATLDEAIETGTVDSVTMRAADIARLSARLPRQPAETREEITRPNKRRVRSDPPAARPALDTATEPITVPRPKRRPNPRGSSS
jgi:hypothetical protein